ncbi:MAG: DEAD/DEAH box helicase, partial [Deltaproteobacteria bacterium]|nr:DEAD/DEAH box helicase [Deltaproteobacteria bacterium]
MTITPHQARYFALDLARRAHARDVSTVGAALFDAQVDLNPHQIEAALFGIRATADSGRLLADEVGLGKTIEAALVLSQLWAERRRRLLVVAPAALRRQWLDELQKKFGLPARLAEGKGGGGGAGGPGPPPELRPSRSGPFEQPAVIVCSYQFAAKHAARVASVRWDLVVIDEAHRLRNAWRATTGTGQALVAALTTVPKLMLTATPLQNSLIELFGLVTLLDPKALGDESTFRARFLKGKTDYADLKQRLAPVCHRTLRREVLPYIRYTQRRPMTWRFSPSQAERELYRAVSDLLARDTLHGLPNAQRALITMVLRKLLASSSAAIAGALTTLRANLVAKRDALAASQSANSGPLPESNLDPAAFEDEGLDDEWLEDLEPLTPTSPMETSSSSPWTMDDELAALDALIALADSIPTDKRALALVDALKVALAEARSLGAAEKAVIFTESRKTQAALAKLLEAHYPGQIVCFNGTNDDPHSGPILDAWEKKYPQAANEGSRAANMRQALVEHFRDHATLFIATEAGAEGLNLQFCSLVVNYDLPWNPQRLEQRIGRCHRYGQRHDVVVVNFLDKDNLADRRVLELLEDKIGLFSGVFGASDAVLGAVESGVGLEKKITRIFQTCRTPDAIEAAFAELRREMDEVIRDKESKAKKALFEHFDDTVHDRLKIQLDLARARLDRMGRQFWALTRWAL